MKELTVIVPIHTYDEEVAKYLDDAFTSYVLANNFLNLKDKDDEISPIVFVGPSDVLNKLDEIEKIKEWPNKSYIINDDNTTFSAQINKAVSLINSKYFSILEFDDMYTKKWFHNFAKYLNEYKDVSIFLPITEVYDEKNKENGPLMFINEAVWASSFSEELGFLDLESLENFGNFNLTGAIFNTEDYLSVGGLKESMKFSFWYEFIMRMAHNSKKMYVIPKVGYKHLLNRPYSISNMYNTTMTSDEVDWWIELAHKEYFFKKDRNKTYDGD